MQKLDLNKTYIALAFALFGFSLSNSLFSEGGKITIAVLIEVALAFIFFISVRFSVFQVTSFIVLFESMVLSGVVAYQYYAIYPKILVYGYFLISVIFLTGAVKLLNSPIVLSEIAVTSFRVALMSALLVNMYLGLSQFIEGGVLAVRFGFDDKSHAAIFLCFYAFFSLLVFESRGYIFSLIFWLLAAVTISRMPYVFLPFLLFSVGVRFVRDFPRLRLQVFITALSLVALTIMMLVTFVDTEYFSGMKRALEVFTDSDSDHGSTLAHTLLLKYALTLKFENIGNILFGIGPGGFGETLLSSAINYSDLSVVDPSFVQFAALGAAPIHSTYAAIFTEFPIWIFLIYMYFNLKMVYNHLLHKNYILLSFCLPFFVSILYYSAHNKPYFWIVSAFLLMDRAESCFRSTRRLMLP